MTHGAVFSLSRFPVLMYHSLPAPGREAGCLPVPVCEFRRQMELLTEHGAVLLGLTDALAAKTAEPSRNVVAVTFDDGLADVINAVDILESLGGRATVYVCSGLLGRGDRHQGSSGSPSRFLCDFQMVELFRRGFEIGSHSVTHRAMDVLGTADLWFESVQSRCDIEQILGAAVRSFCYPFGYSGPRVRTAVAGAGYENACVVGRRLAPVPCDRYAVPRLEVVAGESDAQFVRRISVGEPGFVPVMKRVATPAWRVFRSVGFRVTHGVAFGAGGVG